MCGPDANANLSHRVLEERLAPFAQSQTVLLVCECSPGRQRMPAPGLGRRGAEYSGQESRFHTAQRMGLRASADGEWKSDTAQPCKPESNKIAQSTESITSVFRARAHRFRN